MKNILLIITIFFHHVVYATDSSSNKNTACIEFRKTQSLLVGLIYKKPFLYTNYKNNKYYTAGIDVILLEKIAKKLGIHIKYKELSWEEQLKGLNTGELDLIIGGNFSRNRESYANFSIPYRTEKNSLFIHAKKNAQISFDNISEYLEQISLQNLRLGVIKKTIFGNKEIDIFINDNTNAHLIRGYDDDSLLLNALNEGEIDCFISNSIVTNLLIHETNTSDQINEVVINKEKPVYMLFSKRSVSQHLVDMFNKEISNIIADPDYIDESNKYIHQFSIKLLILSKWYYSLSLLASCAFCISAIMFGIKNNLSLTCICIISLLPNLIFIMIKECVLCHTNNSLFNPIYLYIPIILTVIGIYFFKLISYSQYQTNVYSGATNNIISIADNIGKSIIMTLGPMMIISNYSENQVIFGAILSTIVGHMGIEIRNKYLKPNKYLQANYYLEITLMFSVIITVILKLNITDYNLLKLLISLCSIIHFIIQHILAQTNKKYKLNFNAINST